MKSPDEAEREEWIAEFGANARRPLEQRIRNSFRKTYKPIMDDACVRTFDTTAQYRQWCDDNLPWWLGYATTDFPE